MAQLRIWRSNFERARDRCYLSREEARVVDELLAGKSGDIVFESGELPLPMARALLEDGKLEMRARVALVLRARGMKRGMDVSGLYETVVDSPVEFGSVLAGFGTDRHNAQMEWNGRWYPVIAHAEFSEQDKLVREVSVQVHLAMGREVLTRRWAVRPGLFREEDGGPRDRSVEQVLADVGLRPLRTRPAEHNVLLSQSQRLAAQAGTQVWVKGSVLQVGGRWYAPLQVMALGTPEVPRRAVVEPALSESYDEGGYYGHGSPRAHDEGVSTLPVVRVFSLDTKRYVFADVRDLDTYDYDEAAIDRLVLGEEMRGVLEQVFAAGHGAAGGDENGDDGGSVFGDLVRGKHGGVVILACGGPGVGKTLTAEVYAEVSRRPLYVLEFGELGTSVEAIEQNLETIFQRVVKWNAVLQFDECEVFLAHRGGDLERSAIVGIFLRMLDYYEGLLFLTTNQPEKLDEAVRSRVMLRLDYPDLDGEARAAVWRRMFDAAGMTLEGDPHAGYARLAGHDVNGRQIRNLTRLARIMHPGRRVDVAQVEHLMRYGCR